MKNNDWSKQVLAGGTYCAICGISSTAPYFQPHHYIHKSQSKVLREEIRNGIRVCSACHRKAHSAGGKKFIEDWMQHNRPADKKYCDDKLAEERKIK